MSKKLTYLNFIATIILAIAVVFMHLNAQPTLNDIAPDAGKTSGLENVLSRGTLKCGYINYAPYFIKDPNTGNVSGLMVDLMDEVGKKMDVAIEWSEETDWSSMIQSVNTGRFDAVCSSVWQNPARAKHASFSQAFGYAPVNAYVHVENTQIKSLADINKANVKIVTIDGEMNDFLAKENFPKAQRQALPQTANYAQMMVNIATKKADVVFLEPKIAADYMENNPGKLKKLDDPVHAFPVTLMMKRNAYELKNALDAALYEIIFSPKWKEMVEKHGLSDLNLPTRPF